MGKLIVGIAMIIGGIVLGVYMGLWVCFIGGIVDVINEVRSPISVDALTIAWGIAKIVLAGFVGYLSALILIIPGMIFVKAA